MRRANAAIGSSVFFIAAPTVIGGLLPWWLTRWDVQQPSLSIPFRVIGVAAIVVGTGVLVLAFVRFVVEGSGTPAPVAPTEQLVVGGLYRYVRNPMYLAVEAIILGQALVLGRLSLLWYGAIVIGAFVVFVRGYEEPALTRRFGTSYETYRRAVPAWLPRRHPWVRVMTRLKPTASRGRAGRSNVWLVGISATRNARSDASGSAGSRSQARSLATSCRRARFPSAAASRTARSR